MDHTVQLEHEHTVKPAHAVTSIKRAPQFTEHKKGTTTYMKVKIQLLAWDRPEYVVGLNWLK